MILKFAHYQQLPWKLLQLGHHDPAQVASGAQACLRLWQAGGPGTLHRQSRRFLDETWEGPGNDVSLLPYVRRLASGEAMTSPEFDPLIRWVSRFSTIRLAERSVEGIHSLVTRIYKRARNAQLPYISVDLRFQNFWRTVSSDPTVAR